MRPRCERERTETRSRTIRWRTASDRRAHDSLRAEQPRTHKAVHARMRRARPAVARRAAPRAVRAERSCVPETAVDTRGRMRDVIELADQGAARTRDRRQARFCERRGAAAPDVVPPPPPVDVGVSVMSTRASKDSSVHPAWSARRSTRNTFKVLATVGPLSYFCRFSNTSIHSLERFCASAICAEVSSFATSARISSIKLRVSFGARAAAMLSHI